MHIHPFAKLTPRRFAVPTLVLLVSTLQACSDDLECPAGTRKAGTTCQRVHEVDEGGDDAAVLPAADAGSDAGHDASVDAGHDAGDAPVQCFVDRDHDGVGSGDPMPCNDDDAGADVDAMAPDSARDAAAPDLNDGGAGALALVTLSGDCDDDDPLRAPTLPESCDGIDNDCDTSVDEDSKNACGGTCIAPFEHELGESCSNGLLGACAREGTYTCEGDASLVCNVPEVHPSSEVCADKVDNDCDGETDEADAINATVWYKDCDGDGYAASTAGSVKACAKPAKAGSCTWTAKLPQQAAKLDWDCDDSKVQYKPGASYAVPPAGSASWDLNCDGALTPVSSLATVCTSSFVARLNQDANYCDATVDWGCLVWKDASGRYTNTPPSKCPDPKPFWVSGFYATLPGGHGFWTCTQDARSSSWPCR